MNLQLLLTIYSDRFGRGGRWEFTHVIYGYTQFSIQPTYDRIIIILQYTYYIIYIMSGVNSLKNKYLKLYTVLKHTIIESIFF